ncbi:T9SS type A sorting domain-containing protein [Flavobacterium sp.]|uniref:Ig-like domain-containing protein n=1 Tax=Flavobacterium sp. TaxID=239 RepID=UPI002607DFEC|nr:T9SS type A sorting domain-containing protein [Flavobacterium sp.]
MTQFNAFAQYNGGNSNGATANELSITSCSIPPHFYVYFGGVNDGSSVEELSTTACGIAAFQFAYMGGTADGAATEETSITACGIPPSFYAYFGGNNDGAHVETLEASVCGFPPQFYVYFGGDGDGFTLDRTTPICPTAPPVTDFTASATSVCVGQSVTFTDTSTNIPSAWIWTLTGATPNSATDQNPTVIYNTPGTYTVTLVAANFNGNDTETKTGYITVTAIPTVATTTPASRCATGSVSLGATASAGTLNWYAASTGGSVLGTGTTFATPSISATTTYYVEAANGSCNSARTAVVATINTIPSITATTPGSRCDSGSVTLSASASAGSTVWYAAATGGTPLATTNTFATPNIAATTTYYVEAATATCNSPRTAVIATVNTTPTVTATTPASRCDVGTLILGATASAGTLNWYSVPTGGTVLGTGTSFTTPSIASTTTYYVEAATATCTSPRTAVIATATPTPTITSSTAGSRCDAGTVTLSATSTSGSNTVWYNAATGGTALATTNTFVTPSISTTTTYYVEAVNGSCISTRTTVVATVNTTPTITATTPASRCGNGLVTLSATASAGTLNWYTAPVSGSFVGTGTNISPSILVGTTTFYVEATTGNCTSARTAVTAVANAIPTITAVTFDSRCDAGTLALGATASAGNISWYDVPSGGTALGTGASFTTPSISTTTTYYVETVDATCSSTRTPVTASINPTAAPTGFSNQTFCSGETVGLLGVNGSNVIWYDAPTAGNVVPDNTPLAAGTTYYASQTLTSCESPTRLAVTVTLGTCLGNTTFEMNALKVYPNPVIDVLNVSYKENIDKIEIHNMLGQLIQSRKVNANESRIDLSQYAAATYLVRIYIGNQIKTFKVIKQ